jgi:hypothetical protein
MQPIRDIDASVKARKANGTHISWTSGAEKEYWEDRIRKAARVWRHIEIASVVDHYRAAALVDCDTNEMLHIPSVLAKSDLCVVPVAATNRHSSYHAKLSNWNPKQPLAYKCIVARAQIASEFVIAWNRVDHDGIGEILGFPMCCRQAFKQFWTEQGNIDCTWSMALRSATRLEATSVAVAGYDETNVLLRWLGLRAVPHLPCSFNCELSAMMGRDLLMIGEKLGYRPEVATLKELLSWPVRWCACQGIGTVTLPALRFEMQTDVKEVTLAVTRVGNQLEEKVSKAPEDSFYSLLISRILRVMPRAPKAFLHLGCGNATLTARVARMIPGIHPFGVDRKAPPDADRILQAFDGKLYRVDVADFSASWLRDSYALALIDNDALLDIRPSLRDKLVGALLQIAATVISYTTAQRAIRCLSAASQCSAFIDC